MAEQQSSLRTAIDKIMGWPSQSQGAQGGTGITGGGVVPRDNVVNLGTTSALSNVVPEAVPDPFESQLADIRAQNTALQASLTAPAAAPAAAPATASALTPEQYEANYRASMTGIIPSKQMDIFSKAAVATMYPSYDTWRNNYVAQGVKDPSMLDTLANQALKATGR